jgi:hypothetical protein
MSLSTAAMTPPAFGYLPTLRVGRQRTFSSSA